jgi:hypothetical protein
MSNNEEEEEEEEKKKWYLSECTVSYIILYNMTYSSGLILIFFFPLCNDDRYL